MVVGGGHCVVLLGNQGWGWLRQTEDERAPIMCLQFCSASSELSQPWAHSVTTGSWHLTWEAILFSTALFKIWPIQVIKTTVSQLFREPIFNYFKLPLICVILLFSGLCIPWSDWFFFLELGKYLAFWTRVNVTGRFLIKLTVCIFPVAASPGCTALEFILEIVSVAWKPSDGWLDFSGESCLLWEELPWDHFCLRLELLNVVSTSDWWWATRRKLMGETTKKGKKARIQKVPGKNNWKDLWEGAQRDFWRQERVEVSLEAVLFVLPLFPMAFGQ